MPSFISFFVRYADGSWRCIVANELQSPLGRMQITEGSRFSPGKSFMGVDVAKWLDEQSR